MLSVVCASSRCTRSLVAAAVGRRVAQCAAAFQPVRRRLHYSPTPTTMCSLAQPPLPSAPADMSASVVTRSWQVSGSTPAAELAAAVAEPAALLRAGQLVAFPTETVYGLFGNALSSPALRSIFVAKGRPSDNPLIVHVHSLDQFHALGRDIPQLAHKLAQRFWPGPLTLIVPTSHGEHAASHTARAGLDCVGVRMPSHPVALALLRACNVPLAGPSANLSGRPSPTTAAHVAADLTGRIAGIVDGGAADGVGLESTVVECSDADGGSVTILRPGGITREMLEEVAGVGRVRLDPALVAAVHTEEVRAPIAALPKQSTRRGAERAHMAELLTSSPADAAAANLGAAADSSPVPPASPSAELPAAAAAAGVAPKAPGMKYTHYAPRAPLLLVDGSFDLLLRTAESYLSRGDVVGLLVTREQAPAVATWTAAHAIPPAQLHVQVCGARSDLTSVARDLYGCLRAFDDTHVQIIVSECFPGDADAGIGEALMNRLNKAAGGRVLRDPHALQQAP